MKKVKIPAKEFEEFKKECKKWYDKLGLFEWDIGYAFKPLKSTYAMANINLKGMTAYITMSSELTEENYKIRDNKDSAKHEMMHILLAKFSETAYERFATEDYLYAEEEALVHKLIKLIN